MKTDLIQGKEIQTVLENPQNPKKSANFNGRVYTFLNEKSIKDPIFCLSLFCFILSMRETTNMMVSISMKQLAMLAARKVTYIIAGGICYLNSSTHERVLSQMKRED